MLRRSFDFVLGLVMSAASVYLAINPSDERAGRTGRAEHGFRRAVVDAEGVVHTYSYSLPLGLIMSLGVGYISSLLGIGGGIIHVPLLSGLLNFPVHIATATSHFVLCIMSLTGTAVHIASGTLSHGLHRMFLLAVGVFLGAQGGAALSGHIRGTLIIRSLAVALGLVGIRILLLAFNISL